MEKPNKIDAEVLYIDIGRDISIESGIKSLFQKLFKKVVYFREGREGAHYYRTKKEKSGRPPEVLVLDCSEASEDLDHALRILQAVLKFDNSARSVMIYDKGSEKELFKFAQKGVDYFLAERADKAQLQHVFSRLSKGLVNEKRTRLFKEKIKQCIEEKIESETFFKKEMKKSAETVQLKENFFLSKTREMGKLAGEIMTSNSLLMRIPLNEKQMEYTGKTKYFTEQLQATIRDILEFLGSSGTEHRVENKLFNINIVLDNVASMVGASLKEKGLELVFDVANSVPAMIKGDPFLLSQAVVSLISGIVRIEGANEIVLKLSMLPAEEKKKMLQFEMVEMALDKNSKDEYQIKMVLDSAHIKTAEEMIASMGGVLFVRKS